MTLPATGCVTRLLIMNEIDYKKLFTEARRYFSLEWDYTKLTAVEKMAVLLSAVAFVAVVIIIGTFVLHHLFTALISVLASALGCTWGGAPDCRRPAAIAVAGGAGVQEAAHCRSGDPICEQTVFKT